MGACAWAPFGTRIFFGVFTNKLNFVGEFNFREYIRKIALTRSIFQPKMHQIAFGGRAPPVPDPLWELTALPTPLAGLR